MLPDINCTADLVIHTDVSLLKLKLNQTNNKLWKGLTKRSVLNEIPYYVRPKGKFSDNLRIISSATAAIPAYSFKFSVFLRARNTRSDGEEEKRRRANVKFF